MDWLSGVNWWNYADFGAAWRGDSMPHINQKGLVTFDRKKKDSFYLLKSRWSKEPVLYLQSPTWTERSGEPTKEYSVFTNLDEVELFHNGKSLGKQTSNFKWQVNLVEGENTLLAKSGDMEHGFDVNYEKSAAKYAVTCSHKQEESKFLIDGNPYTRWAAEGKTRIDLDMKNCVLINGVKIQFYKGGSRSYKLKIKGSADGKKWITLFEGVSKKAGGHLQTFSFADQQQVQYLRIEGLGNNENMWNSYYEIVPMITTEKKVKNRYEKIKPDEKN